MTSSETSARMASVMARKSSTAWLGMPSGRRAWMWIITPPASAIRRASAAYSAGVYGMAGHCSRPASAPGTAQVTMTGSSRLIARPGRPWRRAAGGPRPVAPQRPSDGRHTMAPPGALYFLGFRQLERADDRRPRLARVDHVVDHAV